MREDGHHVEEAADGQAAIERLKESDYDLILLDLRMPGLDGIGIVEVLRTWGEDTLILMISGFGTVDAAVTALHAGVDDFLTKPVEPDVLSSRVEALLERRPSAPSAGAEPPGGLSGRSPSMLTVFEIIARVAPTDATVLVTGDTGTGKELVARAIHQLSGRADGPFVAVNCAALAEGVLESELFGHVRGAFTGAARDRKGLFATADGGTLLLDEIGVVSLGMQHRLLRVLQEKECTPAGAVKPVSVDVRIVAATNRDLRAEMEAGRFRDNLYYRLNVMRIEVPPLRERREDIPLIADSFFRRVDLPPHAACSPLAMRHLQAHRWPGNVRELLAALESARIQSGGRRIEAQHLPADVRAPGAGRDRWGEALRGRAARDEPYDPMEEDETVRIGGRGTGGRRLALPATPKIAVPGIVIPS